MSKVLELGGGDNPRFSKRIGNGINVDVRASPQVDLLADFNKPLPFPSEEFDLVYSQFVIEHISWRNVQQFINELYRVLKADGKAVIITANLYEQCKKAISEEWTQNTSCMIFGDLDYPENSHKCGFSPSYVEKLFKNAGFKSVAVQSLYSCATDMEIEATK
jgi:predicted SAM-dependent methyltransferase